jgi:hydroxyacylglutathione hydrolase
MTKVVALKAFMDNYIWVILDDNSSAFSCIDPGDANPVIDFARQQNLKLTHILLTHHHHDHIGGVQQLMQHFPDCLVYRPDDERITYGHPAESIMVSEVFFDILLTPGHTSSHISYYAPEKGWLFCGDTLFSSGCGRVFDGTMQELHHSMQIFKQLPDETLVFCAHEYTQNNLKFAHYVDPQNTVIIERLQKLALNPNQCTLPSTIAFEKQVNPFLRTDKPEIQQFAMQHDVVSNQSLDIFTLLRFTKDSF